MGEYINDHLYQYPSGQKHSQSRWLFDFCSNVNFCLWTGFPPLGLVFLICYYSLANVCIDGLSCEVKLLSIMNFIILTQQMSLQADTITMYFQQYKHYVSNISQISSSINMMKSIYLTLVVLNSVPNLMGIPKHHASNA